MKLKKNRMKKFLKNLGYVGFGLLFLLMYYVVTFAATFAYEFVVILKYFPELYLQGNETEETLQLITDEVMAAVLEITIIAAVITSALIIVILWFGFPKHREDLGLKKPKLLFLPVAVVAGIAMNIVASAAVTLIPFPESWSAAHSESVSFLEEGNPILAVITAVIAAPLVEELVFRCAMFGFTKKAWGTVAAVIFTSVIFGLIHGNIIQFIYTSVVGLLFVYCRIRGKSIWCAFAAHAGFNLGNAAALLLGELEVWAYLLIGAAVLALAVSAIEIFFGHNSKEDIIKA